MEENIVTGFCIACEGIVPFYEGHKYCIECEKMHELQEADYWDGDESDNFLQ